MEGKTREAFRFYLGTHRAHHIDQTEVPLFVSYRVLKERKRKRFNQKGLVCVDSGGFSELSLFGKWKTTPRSYVDGLHRLLNLGLSIEWASIQDWMCEEHMINKTGLTIKEHQKRTIESFETLTEMSDRVRFIPVIQGQTIDHYLAHVDQYMDRGIDLKQSAIVGVGSVCRRQNTTEIAELFEALHDEGLSLHGFGVKTNGLKRYQQFLSSSDSMAWSYGARFNNLKLKCPHGRKRCNNCLHYALAWRDRLI